MLSSTVTWRRFGATMSLGCVVLSQNLAPEQSVYSKQPWNSLDSISSEDHDLADCELVQCTCVTVVQKVTCDRAGHRRSSCVKLHGSFGTSFVSLPWWSGYDVLTVLPLVAYVILCLLSFTHVGLASALPSSGGLVYGTASPSPPGKLIIECPPNCLCLPSRPESPNRPTRASVIINITCANRNLTEVPFLHSQNMDIKVLNFSGNALVGMVSQTFMGLKQLQVLDLSSNHISVVDKAAFRSLDNITHLYLGHNNLSSLHPDTFQNLLRLVHLDLSHNSLSSLPEGLFQSTPALFRLDLHHNKLLSFSASLFSGSSGTPTILDISHNPDLDMGSGVLSSFVHLEDLNLANTGLVDPRSVIEFLSLDTFPRLSHLNLSSNQLTFLNTTHLDILFEKVSILDISKNLFHCDCSVLPMVQWLHNNVQRLTQVTRDWIFPACHSPDTLKNIPVSTLTLGQLKLTCTLLAKCDGANPASMSRECEGIVTTTERNIYQVYMTVAQPVNRTRLVYDSMLLPYDPMLGWYTAAALGGMVGVLLLCLICERVKQRIERYRRRRWRRKCRKMWEAARAAAGEEGSMEESSFPLQTQTPVFYSNDIQVDVLPNSNNPNVDTKDAKTHTVLTQDINSSSTGLTVQINTNGANSRPPSRRLSVSWGPTSDMSDTTPTTPCIMSNHSASKFADFNNQAKTSNVNSRSKSPTSKGREQPPGGGTADANTCKKTPNQERGKVEPPQSLLRALEQACQEIQVSQVHPGCPIHNPHKLTKLKTLLKRNPDKSLQELLKEAA